MEALVLLALLVLLLGPILAIIALVGVRRLEGDPASTRIGELTARVYALERLVEQLRTAAKAGPAPAPEAPAAGERHAEEPAQATLSEETRTPPPAPPPPIVSPAIPPPIVRREVPKPPIYPPPVWQDSSKEALDLEDRIAGRWFSRVGIVAILFSVSFGLKWAFDNEWIGPRGRVAIGILLGALMLPWSHWLLSRGYSYFSEGIAALGEATLFLSVWAGCQYYTLYSRDVGFASMIAITAAMAAVAIGRDSQRIAVLSLIGGLLTPALVSSGQNQQVVLFTYLLLLGAGALVIQWKKTWNALALISFIGSQIYFWGWYSEFFHVDSPVERTVIFATLFFLLYAALPTLRAFRGAGMDELDVAMVLFNSFAFAGAIFVLLWPNDKWPLTLLFLALAAAHVAIARLIPAPKPEASGLPRLIFAGLALTFLTLAIPVRLEGNSITLSFAVEGAVLVWTGFRSPSNFLRQSGYLLLAVAALRLVVWPPAGGTIFLNARFGAYLAMIACFAVALWSARSHGSEVAGQERIEVGIFAIAINVYALTALSLEFWDYFGKAATGMDAALAQHLSLSVLWTAYAAGLLTAGTKTKSALLRWQSLVLFGAVMGKVFFYDLSFLDRGYRILSFFVLGAVLMAVSFFYTRKLAQQRGKA